MIVRNTWRFSGPLCMMMLVIAACDSNDDGGDNGNYTPSPYNLVQISGTVRDTQGQPLNGAAIHIVHEGEGLSAFTLDRYATALDDSLPSVDLTSFDVIAEDGEVTLRWVTASENNADYFELTRDGALYGNFQCSNNVSGATYSHTDTDWENGTTYSYTLLVVDLNGAREELASGEATPGFHESPITDNASHQNYPNPFRSQTSIRLAIPEYNTVSLRVFDAMGQEEMTLVDRTLNAGVHMVTLASDSLPNGLHEYRLQVSDTIFWSRFMLRRETAVQVLSRMKPLAVSWSDGSYALYIPAGATSELIDESGNHTGTASLSSVSIISLAEGFAPAVESVSISEDQNQTVDLVHSQSATLPQGLIVQLGDTTVIIPDSAQAFADANFSHYACLLREYHIAMNPSLNELQSQYPGSFAQWRAEPWQFRGDYLPLPYTYDLPETWQHSPSEYYDWISRYDSQFGYGWRDTYGAGIDPLTVSPHINIWQTPSDPTVIPDDPATIAFDGTSNLLERYRNMWIRIVNH